MLTKGIVPVLERVLLKRNSLIEEIVVERHIAKESRNKGLFGL